MAFGGLELLDDLTAEVLRRLPPRSLAVSRCVCQGWRDLVDAGRLLRVDLLPRSVGGIFMHYCQLYNPEFLARPTTGRRPSISGDLDFVPDGCSEVLDHCNGLLLCMDDPDSDSGSDFDFHDYVANPATRRWARLPRPLSQIGQIKCLMYDPTVSPYYEVFSIHPLRDNQCQKSCPLQAFVYSSVTGRWEERLFVPEEGEDGRVVETIAVDDFKNRNRKVYWRGALYLLCQNDGFVLRVSISDANYRVIPVPAHAGFNRSHKSLSYGILSLGISEKGVYCASEYGCRLRIFLLNESSCGHRQCGN